MAENQIAIPRVKLNNGIYMPVLGYGTWLGLNDKGEFDMTDCLKMQDCLSYAIDIGYRHIDTAHLYRVEPEVGQAIRMKIKEGKVKREDLFVTTKVWHHFHRPEDVLVSCKGSLRRLDMKYVDQLLMHWPMSINQKGVDEKIDYLETWKGFEAVYNMGLAKSIGVSNFNIDQLKRLVANCTVKPAANQVEINLNLGQSELVDYCKSEDIAVVAYSPFGTMVPSRSTKGSPEPKLENPTMVHIGKRYGKTVTQITLRYLYQRGIISIPKTVTKARVLENANIFDFNLFDDDMAEIAKFDVNYRTVRPVFWQEYANYPFDKIELKEIPPIPEALKKWKNGLREDIS